MEKNLVSKVSCKITKYEFLDFQENSTNCQNFHSYYFLGCVINDSHSEIVARRCLILYLYKQMEYAVNSSEMSDVSENKSVLTKSNDGKYKVKEGVNFHLFITTALCGDARIFSLH